jgi:bifunctional non-homologous end joining protein LigD
MTRSGRTFAVSNPDKVLFPDDGITKQDLADYYRRVAHLMLPHLRRRPLVMERFPNGIGANGFLQKDVDGHAPPWVDTLIVQRRRGGSLTHVLGKDELTLAWLADQACITIHTWLSLAEHLEQPDQMIFDLDPGKDAGVVVDAAHALHQLLEEVEAPSFPKLTGSRGIHVHVPLEPDSDFDDVRATARVIADILVARHPEDLTTSARKADRQGALYVDTLRNAYGQHAAAPYTVRPHAGAPVAAPVAWNEIRPGLDGRRYPMVKMLRRLARSDDPWKSYGRGAPHLKAIRDRVDQVR